MSWMLLVVPVVGAWNGCPQMTPTEQQNRHRRHWDLMTYPEKLRYISTMFDGAPVDQAVWQTTKPFSGWHGYDWYRIEWP